MENNSAIQKSAKHFKTQQIISDISLHKIKETVWNLLNALLVYQHHPLREVAYSMIHRYRGVLVSSFVLTVDFGNWELSKWLNWF